MDQLKKTGRILNGFRVGLLIAMVGVSAAVLGQSITITTVTPNPVCAGGDITVTFTVSGTFDSTFTVNSLPSGVSESGPGSPITVTIAGSVSGDFSIWVTATSAAISISSDTMVVTAQSPPNAGTNGTLTICAGSTLTAAQLFAQLGGTPVANGAWSPPLAGAGTYTYTVPAIAPCTGPATSQVVVTAQSPPNAGTNGTLTICAGSTLTAAQLFAQLGGTPVANGAWSPPLAGAGTYTYTVTAIAPCTGSATATVIVTESISPAPPIVTPLEGDTLCNGQWTTLRVNNALSGAAYLWTTTSGLITQIMSGAASAECGIRWLNAPPTAGPTGTVVNGNYTVTVTVGSCSAATTGTLGVSNFYASCPKGIVFFEPYGLAVLDPVANHFQWGTLNAQGSTFMPVEGEVDQSLFRSELTSLTSGLGASPPFVVRSSIYPDKCFSYTTAWVDSIGLERVCLAPIDSLTTEPGHVVYPNPSQGKSLTIEAKGKPLDGPVSLELFDMHGHLMHKEQLLVQPIAQLGQDLSGLGRGMYLLRLRSDRSEETIKLILD